MLKSETRDFRIENFEAVLSNYTSPLEHRNEMQISLKAIKQHGKRSQQGPDTTFSIIEKVT
jgi:hypothetical protein